MVHILLIEDNEMNRAMLSRRLRRNGHEVSLARDGQEGVNKVKTLKPDLILMDINLPILDGWTATRYLKNDLEVAHIPIIALTAYAIAEDRDNALQAGCDDYETKPIELSRLLEKIQAAINKSV